MKDTTESNSQTQVLPPVGRWVLKHTDYRVRMETTASGKATLLTIEPKNPDLNPARKSL